MKKVAKTLALFVGVALLLLGALAFLPTGIVGSNGFMLKYAGTPFIHIAGGVILVAFSFMGESWAAFGLYSVAFLNAVIAGLAYNSMDRVGTATLFDLLRFTQADMIFQGVLAVILVICGKMNTARQQVMRLLHKVVTAQEDERARIARDLHDQLGQQLTALRLALDQYGETLAPRGNGDPLERAKTLARELDASVDFLAWELRPAVLDDLGLAAALPRFLDQWTAHYGLPTKFQSTGPIAGRLSVDEETAFYRIAQEALTNVVKHAHATRVDVVLEGRADDVILVVEDDGVGFEVILDDARTAGVGLIGMRERASLIGATLQVESGPGKGTTIYLRLPVGERAPA